MKKNIGALQWIAGSFTFDVLHTTPLGSLRPLLATALLPPDEVNNLNESKEFPCITHVLHFPSKVSFSILLMGVGKPKFSS